MDIKGNDRSDVLWSKVMIGSILTAMSMSILVLGAVGIVSIVNSESNSGSAVSAPNNSEVQVTLSEFKITIAPAEVPPGIVTFTITNSGTTAHDFMIPDLGQNSPMINAGETATLVTEFPDVGTYKVLCGVPGHEAAGMVSSLNVSSSATIAAPPPNPDATHAGQAEMSWQEMDSMMLDVANKFPAATAGVGNGILDPIISADGFKEFHLTASIIKWEVEPGVFVDGWAYNGEIPGPILQVYVGDKVRIVLKNELPESTTIHFHGVRVPNAMDGVDPFTQEPIHPGDSFTYEFSALEPSVGMYHSHHNAQVQVPNGLAGALLIGDWKLAAMGAAGDRVSDFDGIAEQEIVMVLNDSGTIGLSLNGKSFPATTPYKLKVGETMVVHYFNEGSMSHPMHLHQPSGLIVARDGVMLESPYWADTISVAPGERWTVVYTAQDAGVWAWHCHILNHAETPTGMRYMVTALIVE
ncbi:MAG: multicopper oxidase domain-containing protein [Ilumatobacteraceae bacterium]